MAKTYADIQKEIASLQRAAEVVRRKEIDGVVQRIKVAIASYGLSAADLGFDVGVKTRATRGRATTKATKSAGTPKYRDESGKTWTGHGRRPAWFLAALAAGKTPDDLRA
jgi:DNA-binding protein H-NS